MLGTTLRILGQDEAWAAELSRVLSAFDEVSSPARAKNILQVTADENGLSVYHDCRRLAHNADTDRALAALVAGLNQAAVERSSLFAIHSGAVSWDGGIVALPAISGNGKSTLTAALVRTGLGYLSDEALVFADDGTVIPYPKPLTLSSWSAKTLSVTCNGDETLVTPSNLGGSVGDGGHLTDLVLSEYGHDEPVIEPLPKSQAVAALIRFSFNHYKDPERAFRIATEVARDVNVWQLKYDDPIDAARLISNTLP